MLVSRVRGTVQGVLGASLHLLWYLDWQMGGGARDALRPLRPARPAHGRGAA
jgi:hypothetical protein